jgi:CheY-like chemotaxis protein
MTMFATADGTPLNILLVEDDDGDVLAVQRTFRKANIGNPVLRAVDGVEALDMLRGTNGKEKAAPPLLLLVDLNMPRMNGFQFVQALRQDEALRHSIAFMLTTSKREADKIAARDLDVAGYIVKGLPGQEPLGDLVSLMNRYCCTAGLTASRPV